MFNNFKKMMVTTIALLTITTTTTAQTANSNYLDLANYATIGNPPNNNYTGDMINLYKYTENNDGTAWLTLSAYGAAYTAGNQSGNQKWIETSNRNWETENWSESFPFQGWEKYFKPNETNWLGFVTARYYRTFSSDETDRTITFYVTNTTSVILYGYNSNVARNWHWITGLNFDYDYYPTTFEAFECENNNGTLTPQSQAFKSESNSTDYTTINFTLDGLDPCKIYKVVAKINDGSLYEVGFKKPAPVLNVDPAELTFDCPYKDNNTHSDDITVNGWGLKSGSSLTATFKHSPSMFSVDPTSLSYTTGGIIKDKEISVTFNPQANGSYTDTLTLSVNGGPSVTVKLIANVYINVEITDAKVATFYYDIPVLIPYSEDGLKDVSYPHEIVNNSSLNFIRIPNNIPANTPVILEGEPDFYKFYRNNGTVTPLDHDNLLSGSLTGTYCETVLTEARTAGQCGPNAYVMTIGHEVKTNQIGFHRYLGSELGAHKAFLIYDPGTTNNNVSFLSINRDNENTDGIRDVRALNSDDAWYTLQGARLSGKPSQRGIYIHGGKKVTLK